MFEVSARIPHPPPSGAPSPRKKVFWGVVRNLELCNKLEMDPINTTGCGMGREKGAYIGYMEKSADFGIKIRK